MTSWAAIDGDEIRKPLWWALKSRYADRILTVQTRPDPVTGEPRQVLAVVNDTDQRWAGTVSVRRERLTGTALAGQRLGVDAQARAVVLLDLPDQVGVPGDGSTEVLIAELADDRTAGTVVREVHCWVEDIDLRLDPDPVDVVARPVDDSYRVSVTARSLVKDLTLLVDRLDPAATVDRTLVTLPAGASITLHVRTRISDAAEALCRRPVLRTANDLAIGARGDIR